MALSLDWENRIINIPRADMALVQSSPSEIREQSLITLFGLLRQQEETAIGILYPPILEYVKAFSVSGAELAPGVKIINNYTVTFEDGQYAVNLVGANSNVADRVNVNQVSVRSANSAGLVQTREIEHSSFMEVVHFDQANGTAGTAYPQGTPQKPVNNLPDMKFIAGLRGFDDFHVIGNWVLEATDSISGYFLIGKGAESTVVTLTSGCSTHRTTFEEMSVSGRQSGETHYKRCDIGYLQNVHCDFSHCRLIGPMEMSQTSTDTTNLDQCYAAEIDGVETIIDMNNSRVNMVFNHFSGKLRIINMNHPSATNVIINGTGKVTIDDSCTSTSGTIKLRGNIERVGNGGGVNIDDDTTAALVWQRPVEGTFTAEEVLRLMSAALAGKVSGAESGTINFRDLSDTKNRITATVDADGNRTAVTRDVQ